jgi:hypothetical protein
MGFMDSLKDAFGGDEEQHQPAPMLVLAQGRHADRDAPAERMEDSELVTGGKHRA